jgi:hypothetical protein
VSPPVAGDFSADLNTPEPTELAGTERKSTRKDQQERRELLQVVTRQHEKQGENTVSRLRGAAGGASWSEIRGLISLREDFSDYVRRHLVATGDKSHVGSVELSTQQSRRPFRRSLAAAECQPCIPRCFRTRYPPDEFPNHCYPPPAQIATLLYVVVGTEMTGPFGKATLRALVNAEKLSGKAFSCDMLRLPVPVATPTLGRVC